MPQSPSERCPDDARLRALTSGGLEGEALARTREHVTTCDSCRVNLRNTPYERTLSPPAELMDTIVRSAADEDPVAGLAITDEAPGRYEILGELGRGSQSLVYIARDTHLGRDVALKVPRPGPNGEVRADALAGFLREARITARLEHPNIVPIHEIGRRQDGSWYCTQRLIRARGTSSVRTLATALRAAQNIEERLGLLSHLVDVCSAVAHAHLRGVVHRDLKPDNVVIGELGETIVLDWGIAQTHDADTHAPQGTNRVVGTPLYMAPEQARGELQRVDARSDVWSLGVMLYELLTGERAFAASDINGVLEKVRRGETVPVLTRQKDAPRALAAVAKRCLSQNPADRYSDAAELGAELAAFLSHRPVRAYSYRFSELLRLFVERHTAVSIIGAVSVVLLAVAAVATVQSFRRARVYLSEALVEKARASEAAMRWDEAAAYYAAARVEADTPSARYGSMLASSRSDTRLRRLVGHVGSVKALAASPDHTRLLSGGFDGTLKLWHATTGQLVWSVEPGGGPIVAVAFSNDGKAVFVASEDNRLRRFGADGGSPTLIRDLPALVNAIRLLPSGEELALALENNTVWLLSLRDSAVRVLEGHGNPVYALAISPDGRTLASGSWDRTIRLWDLRTGEFLRALTGNEDSVLSLQFTSAGRTLVSGSRDSSIRLWDIQTGAMLERLAGHTQKVTSLSLSPSTYRLASVSNDRTSRVWAMLPRPRALIGASLGVDEALTATVFLGEDVIAVGGEDGALYLRTLSPFDAADFTEHFGATAPSTESLGIAGGRLISSERSPAVVGVLRLRDSRSLLPLAGLAYRTTEGGNPASSISVSRSGSYVAGECGALDCLDEPNCEKWALCLLEMKSLRVRFNVHAEERVMSTGISPDEKRVVVGLRTGHVLVLDASDGREVHRITEPRSSVFDLDFSPDGTLLAVASYDRVLRVYDTARWQMRVLGAHEHGIRAARFSPDGKLIVTGGYDRIVRIWDVAEGREVAALKGHQEVVRSVVFSPDGKALASGAWDGTVRLWDVKAHEELARYVTNDVRVHSVLFAPDGSALFYGGVAPYRVDFPELSSPRQALAETLQRTGFRLEGSTAVRRR